MNILDIVYKQSTPKPWAEGEKIPWHQSEFSERMLLEHLSQEHDAASRRFEIIDQHVKWIHTRVLKGNPTRILDLGCGPGLYTNRLARQGHQCVGIDFSPASIAYAKEIAEQESLDCKYLQQDIRTADYDHDYGLVMSIFGEFNVFRRSEAKRILLKAYSALAPNGYLLLEPHIFDKVTELGLQPKYWYSAKKGLFSAAPHLYLQESYWDAEENVAIQRYYIIDAGTGNVESHSSSMQAYRNEEYESLLVECGFGNLVLFPSLGEGGGDSQNGLMAILAQKEVT